MSTFDKEVVAAIVAHMGEDHGEDNLIIARAHGAPEATDSVFVDLDGEAGVWRVTEAGESRDIRIDWPSGKISDRPEIRREVVLIFREACKRLGIDPKTKEPYEEAKPFAQVLREGSWNDHDDSEGTDFMASIMRGTASLADYVALVAQHYFMYVALEEVSNKFKADPDFAPFHSDDLLRLETLRADLDFLIGSDWESKIEPEPATKEYVKRILEVGEQSWIPGIVAHHYTRYLGDLSGGQMIAKRVARQHEFQDGKGIEFYNFESLGSLDDFKVKYREALNSFGAELDEQNKELMLDEVRAAYRFNTEVFIDMARSRVNQ